MNVNPNLARMLEAATHSPLARAVVATGQRHLEIIADMERAAIETAKWDQRIALALRG